MNFKNILMYSLMTVATSSAFGQKSDKLNSAPGNTTVDLHNDKVDPFFAKNPNYNAQLSSVAGDKKSARLVFQKDSVLYTAYLANKGSDQITPEDDILYVEAMDLKNPKGRTTFGFNDKRTGMTKSFQSFDGKPLVNEEAKASDVKKLTEVLNLDPITKKPLVTKADEINALVDPFFKNNPNFMPELSSVPNNQKHGPRLVFQKYGTSYTFHFANTGSGKVTRKDEITSIDVMDIKDPIEAITYDISDDRKFMNKSVQPLDGGKHTNEIASEDDIEDLIDILNIDPRNNQPGSPKAHLEMVDPFFKENPYFSAEGSSVDIEKNFDAHLKFVTADAEYELWFNNEKNSPKVTKHTKIDHIAVTPLKNKNGFSIFEYKINDKDMTKTTVTYNHVEELKAAKAEIAEIEKVIGLDLDAHMEKPKLGK